MSDLLRNQNGVDEAERSRHPVQGDDVDVILAAVEFEEAQEEPCRTYTPAEGTVAGDDTLSMSMETSQNPSKKASACG
ncbi:MAG: hypothetical protein SGPRY_008035, partial [Prymnesium sp.]